MLSNHKMKSLRDKEEQKGTEEDEQAEVEDNGVNDDSSSEQHNNTSISPQPMAADPKKQMVSFSNLPIAAINGPLDAPHTAADADTHAAGDQLHSLSADQLQQLQQQQQSVTMMNDYIFDSKTRSKRRKKSKVIRSSSSDRLMMADESPMLNTEEAERISVETEMKGAGGGGGSSRHRKTRSLPYIKNLHVMLNRLDGENRTALSHACEKGQKEVIEFLLSEQGIEIEAGGKHHEESWTNLHWACRYGHHEIVQLLLNKGANINAQTSKKSTSLSISPFTLCVSVWCWPCCSDPDDLFRAHCAHCVLSKWP